MKTIKELIEAQHRIENNPKTPAITEKEKENLLALANIELENWKNLPLTRGILKRLETSRNNLLSTACESAELQGADEKQVVKFLVAANTIKRIIQDINENPILNQ